MLSSKCNGERVSLLMNVFPDSANGEMVTRFLLFDKTVSDLHQETSIITSVLTSSFRVIVQVKLAEAVPAYSGHGPLGTEIVTVGGGTIGKL